MIRRADIADAAAIARIHVKAWRAAYAGIVPNDYLAALCEDAKTAFWEGKLASARSTNLVAVEDGGVVGWASGGACRDEDAADCSEIYAIYVSPHAWGRGTGRELMAGMEALFSGTEAVVLWVLRDNVRAVGFYETMGYQADGSEKEIAIGGVRLLEVRFRKSGRTMSVARSQTP